jgi:DNA polymerase III sliding clamp (beta) subunit (PCNA family)
MKAKELRDTLNLVRSSLSNLEFMPILTHFCFVSEQGTVYAYNDITALLSELPLAEGLTMGIPGVTLLDLVGTLPDDAEVSLTNGGGNVALFKSGKTKIELACLNHDEFLFEPPRIPHAISITVTDEFVRALELVMPSLGDDALEKALTAVLVDMQRDAMEFYTSNRRSLTHTTVPVKDGGGFRMLWPKSFCEQLLTLRKQFDTAELLVGEKWLLARFPDEKQTRLYSKLLPEKPVDLGEILESVLPKPRDPQWVKIPDGMVAALNRVMVMVASESTKACYLRLDEDGLRIEARSSLGEVNEFLPFKGSLVKTAHRVVPEPILKAIPNATHMALTKNCLALRGEGYHCVISNLSQ